MNYVRDSKMKLYLRQLLTALAPLLGVTTSGMGVGYTAILFPQLKALSFNSSESSSESADHFGALTIDQESWIAAAGVLLVTPGCWIGGFMAEKFGRKTSLALLFPVYHVSWLIIGLASNVEALMAGRLLNGFCVGVQASIFPIYVGETSDPVLRGVLLGAVSLTLSVGILVCHAMGTWLHWRTTAYICAALPVISWIIGIFSRESPMWLLGKGRIEQARSAWIFLRGERSLEEFSLLENTRLAEISVKKTGRRSMLRSLRKTWSSRYFARPLVIVSVYFVVMQFAGANVMAFYCVDMLTEILDSTYAYLITLIIDAIRLAGGILACVLLKTCRRRVMTFTSGYGVAVVMLSLSACLTFNIGKPWIPAVLLVTYVGLLPLGLIPVAWLLCGELFSRKFRGLGSGLTSGLNFICMFVVIKTTPAMMEFIKPEGTFAVYGSVALIGTSVLYFVLPETMNKTLQEIQAFFDKEPRMSGMENVAIPLRDYGPSEKSEKLEKELQGDV
ncbi:facilitated trehalose transporter Tret1-like [Linepithema humile]|uniref:facilitated trehalose transporter Tret1-like n=1 Tax=Linepithema humile TaxID=83485 RepID=UPI00351F6E6D